ncbi:hypothetical protein ACH4SP_20905 [Streptomyces sp. NPDC021093]|uniref:hypothetical protein n=1 Tax=Streptomyces sp. NPDC021093 TaxID=3365112 RepID=UPI0037A7500E
MGTSSRWEGPRGGPEAAADWGRISGRLSRWRAEQPDAPAKLDRIAEDYLEALHRTLREDPSAFGLHDAACAAGERLAVVMDALPTPGGVEGDPEGPGSPGPPDFLASPGFSDSSEAGGDDFVSRFTAAVGSEGGTLTDAAVRRAAAAVADRIRRKHPEALAPGGSGWSGDLLCLLYQWFFAGVVAEFLRMVIAEKVKLMVPVLPLVDSEDRIAGWVAKQVLRLLPSPCEEAERLAEAAEQEEGEASALEEPLLATLGQVARGLVPRAVGTALGLLTEPGSSTGPHPPADEEAPAA